MADDISITPGNGAVVATDEIDGRHHQTVKIEHGAEGTATPVSAASPLPVTVQSAPAVEIAEGQSVEVSNLPPGGKVSELNSGSGEITLPYSGWVLEGTWEEVLDYASIEVEWIGDIVPSQLLIEFSSNGINTQEQGVVIVADWKNASSNIRGRYVRVSVYIWPGEGTGTIPYNLVTLLKKEPIIPLPPIVNSTDHTAVNNLLVDLNDGGLMVSASVRGWEKTRDGFRQANVTDLSEDDSGPYALDVADGGGSLTVDIRGDDGDGNVTDARVDTGGRLQTRSMICGIDDGTLRDMELIDGAIPVTVRNANISTNTTDRSGQIFTEASGNVPTKLKSIAASSNGNNTIVAAVANRNIRVLALTLSFSGAVNAKFQSGAGGTDITGLFYGGTGTLVVLPYNPHGWFETAAGALLNLDLSGAVAVGGCLTYVEA